MKTANLCRLLAVTILLLTVAAVAQKTTLKYDPATEVTLKGTVEEIKEVPHACLGDTGVHLMLKTEKETVEVQVGPPEFLKFMEVTFAKGDKLDVVGSKVTREGGDLVLAREITRDKNVLVARDKKGGPVWTWMKKTGEAAK